MRLLFLSPRRFQFLREGSHAVAAEASTEIVSWTVWFCLPMRLRSAQVTQGLPGMTGTSVLSHHPLLFQMKSSSFLDLFEFPSCPRCRAKPVLLFFHLKVYASNEGRDQVALARPLSLSRTVLQDQNEIHNIPPADRPWETEVPVSVGVKQRHAIQCRDHQTLYYCDQELTSSLLDGMWVVVKSPYYSFLSLVHFIYRLACLFSHQVTLTCTIFWEQCPIG